MHTSKTVVRSYTGEERTRGKEGILTAERPRIIENQKNVFYTMLISMTGIETEGRKGETYVKNSLPAKELGLLHAHNGHLEHHSQKPIPTELLGNAAHD